MVAWLAVSASWIIINCPVFNTAGFVDCSAFLKGVLRTSQRPPSPVSVVDPIEQIFGYMGYNKPQYGVLSTYERTWFLRRP